MLSEGRNNARIRILENGVNDRRAITLHMTAVDMGNDPDKFCCIFVMSLLHDANHGNCSLDVILLSRVSMVKELAFVCITVLTYCT